MKQTAPMTGRQDRAGDNEIDIQSETPMAHKHELRLVHRMQLSAARQIAFDLCRLGVPKTARRQPGLFGKMMLRSRLWVCHFILR